MRDPINLHDLTTVRGEAKWQVGLIEGAFDFIVVIGPVDAEPGSRSVDHTIRCQCGRLVLEPSSPVQKNRIFFRIDCRYRFKNS